MKRLVAALATGLIFSAPSFADPASFNANSTDRLPDYGVTAMAPADSFRESHAWVGLPVFDERLDQIGEVVRVSTDAQSRAKRIVIETSQTHTGDTIATIVDLEQVYITSPEDGRRGLQLGVSVADWLKMRNGEIEAPVSRTADVYAPYSGGTEVRTLSFSGPMDLTGSL
ncbi:hypothetical protein [Ponticaulis profundi]|uniref:PRC-barrel domain-containing protein n=1 Tax=Ponticaulis profundi TaxID=2665222 RepID=A0ABW1S7A5_9PROT